MFIHFIGPGGAGKTTLAHQLQRHFAMQYHDLDAYFLTSYGDITQYIQKYGYRQYTIQNFQLYTTLKNSLDINQLNIIVCSSGFMTYSYDIDENYFDLKQQIELDAFTFLCLPSLDVEICVQEILRRQMQRNYLNTSIEKEENKIRKRLPIYLNLRCKKLLTMSSFTTVADNFFILFNTALEQTSS